MPHRPVAAVLTALILAAGAAAQDSQKAYELKLACKPTVGHKSEVTETQSQTQNITAKVGDQVVNRIAENKNSSFAAVEEIAKVDGDKIAEAMWTFSKAVRVEEGKEVPYGFQGKKVRVTRSKEGPPAFAYEDGTKPEAEDEQALKEAVGSDYQSKPGPTGEEVFAPKKPVKVGESWAPSVKEIAELFMGQEATVAIDVEKSKASFTLKSAEAREGAHIGKIEGILDMVFTQFGPLKLDKPLPARISVQLDAFIDGKRPDGEMRMKMELKGASTVTDPNGTRIDLDMDMLIQSKMTKKTLP